MEKRSQIRIYVHFQTTQAPWGGGNNFLRALVDAIPRYGGEVSPRINDDYDIFLFNNGYEGPRRYVNLRTLDSIRLLGRSNFLTKIVPPGCLAAFRRPRADRPGRRKILVHRLDGIGRLYGRTDPTMDKVQIAANQFADFTVFQSRFCLESFEKEGFKSDKWVIIGNGADASVFYPPTAPRKSVGGPLRLAACAWSDNPMKGHETLARLSEMRSVSISFVGRWPQHISPKNVRLLGPMSQTELGAVLRDHEGFVHAARNDPCPNVVYEALGCGLPVLYLASGGTPEIVGQYGIPLEEPYSTCLESFCEKLPRLREQVLADQREFSIDRACREYMALFCRLCTS